MKPCLIVLVLYKQKLTDSASYLSLLEAWTFPEPMRLLVYDNSPEPQAIAPPSNLEIEYVHDPSNPGVGKAYNLGGKIAQDLGIPWMMLADQDTIFPNNIFQAFDEGIRGFPEVSLFAPSMKDQYGLLSPFYPGQTSGRRLSGCNPGRYSLRERAVINSGMLISVRKFHQAGGYDERLELDFSDIRFLHKLSQLIEDMVIVDALCEQHHSDAVKGGVLEAMHRFESYARSARYMGQVEHASWAFRLRMIGRAAKLSLRYKSLHFLRTALTTAS